MIRMRINKDSGAKCKVCGNDRSNSLELFDISFTDKNIITICDLCNETLSHKTLKAICGVNGKVKSSSDMAIIRKRRNGSYIKAIDDLKGDYNGGR